MQSTVEIKLAKENQLLEVMYIVRECAEQLAETGINLWHDMSCESPKILDDIKQNQVFLAARNRVPLATITLKPNKERKDAALIDRLAIFPFFQKKGLATQMLAFAEEWASNNDFTTLCATVPTEDKPVVDLLERTGFANRGPAPESSEEFVQVVFEKEL